ncbi:hypothetical protein IFR05_006367 [Cadophora sp. M221]|nr:hypothetical protein IFR05_006367 [Cadophora sp. M221]
MASEKGSILVTGPNGGIGIGFVTQFLQSPYAVTHSAIYAVRDPAKATDLKAALKKAPKGHKYVLLPIDLTSQESIRAFAAEVNSRIASGAISHISALILNAGVQDTAKEYFTNDGFERTFFVNYLANFLLTILVLQSMDKGHGRIIYTGSTATDIWWSVNSAFFSSEEQKKSIVTSPEKMGKGIEEFPDGDVGNTGQRRYALSKILMEAWMYELQRRLNADPALSNISVLGHDPGWIGGTSLIRNGNTTVKIAFAVLKVLALFTWMFSSNPMIRTPGKNGKFLLAVCFDREKFGEFPKALYVDGGVLYKTVPEAYDEGLQKELWEKSLVFVGVKEGETVLKGWNVYNLKRKMTSLPPIPRSVFDEQILTSKKEKSDSESQEDEDDDEFEEEDEEFTPTRCLFCPTSSQSTSNNLSHMSLSHNFIIPDLEHLLDVESFLGYLSTIINTFHECLSCGSVKSGKYAVQDHMRGKGHCRLNLEDDALELGDFWEVDESEEGDGHISEEDQNAVLVEGELRLASGKILGTRTKTRNLRPKTSSVSRSGSSSPPQQPIDGQFQPEASSSSGISTVRRTAPKSGPSNERRIVPRPGTSTSLIGLSDVQQRALRATEMKIEKVETKAKKMYEAKVDKKGNKQKTFRVLTMGKKAGGLEKRNG